MVTPPSKPGSTSPFPYRMTRVGVVMRPDPADPNQQEGVLNPAAGFAPDGRLMIFPRLVAEGNRSRIGVGEVEITDGVPTGVSLSGIALQPERGWEHGSDHGGVEDPRLTYVEPLGLYVMTYVAYGPTGARPALAVSRDLAAWERLGPVLFEYDDALHTDLNLFSNKDVLWFPEAVPGPDATPCLAFLHRPTFEIIGQEPELPAGDRRPASGHMDRVRAVGGGPARRPGLVHVLGNRELARSEHAWESLKIGGGPPPIRVPEGWLLLHHGVTGSMTENPFELQKDVFYSAGAMILSAEDPTVIVHRTVEPLLAPETDEERVGIVGNVVFPTAISRDRGRPVLLLRHGRRGDRRGSYRPRRRVVTAKRPTRPPRVTPVPGGGPPPEQTASGAGRLPGRPTSSAPPQASG